MKEIAFLLARLVIATSMLGHGLVRLPKLGAFSQWMTDTFSQSMMPRFVVVPFSFALPVVEFVLGILLLSGFLTHQALIAGSLVMVALIFGSCLLENWEWVTFQMFYGVFFSMLLYNLQHNFYSVDHFLKIKKQS